MTNHLIDALNLGQHRCPEKVFAVVEDGPEVSFAALFDGAAKMASALVELGVAPGDRVAVQVAKSIQAVQLYLGTVMAGGVFLPLNTAYTAAEVGYFVQDAAPRVLVCDPNAKEELRSVAFGAQLRVLGPRGETDLGWERCDPLTPVSRKADDLAAILYTSGTTGRSKGAMLSHGNLASNSMTLKDLWRFKSSDVLIHALPIFHTHGLFVATNIALMACAQVRFLSKFDATRVLDLLPGATAMMGVPTFYTRLLGQPGLTPMACETMRLFISGSAPLLASTHREWTDRTGHQILERYGMTETNMSTSNPYDGARKPGTVGQPLPGVELKIVQNGIEVPDGDIGVIEVRGPNVFQGYWNMPEKTAKELRPSGWFITGDQAVRDSDGYITIVGRAKDMIIAGGFNIYPKEVESVIDAVPGVIESAIIGAPHPDLGEGVVAVVATKDPTLSQEVLAAAIADRLARFKHPRAWIFLPELPRNTMGKVQKKALREQFGRVFRD